MCALCFDVQSVGNRVGVQEPFLMRMAHGAPVRASYRSNAGTKGLQGKLDNRSLNDHMLSDENMLRICRRFFVSLILSRLVQVNFLDEWKTLLLPSLSPLLHFIHIFCFRTHLLCFIANTCY